MEVREVVGVFVALIFLAGLSVAIINGDQTAAVLQAGTSGFANMVRASTLQSQGK